MLDHYHDRPVPIIDLPEVDPALKRDLDDLRVALLEKSRSTDTSAWREIRQRAVIPMCPAIAAHLESWWGGVTKDTATAIVDNTTEEIQSFCGYPLAQFDYVLAHCDPNAKYWETIIPELLSPIQIDEARYDLIRKFHWFANIIRSWDDDPAKQAFNLQKLPVEFSWMADAHGGYVRYFESKMLFVLNMFENIMKWYVDFYEESQKEYPNKPYGEILKALRQNASELGLSLDFSDHFLRKRALLSNGSPIQQFRRTGHKIMQPDPREFRRGTNRYISVEKDPTNPVDPPSLMQWGESIHHATALFPRAEHIEIYPSILKKIVEDAKDELETEHSTQSYKLYLRARIIEFLWRIGVPLSLRLSVYQNIGEGFLRLPDKEDFIASLADSEREKLIGVIKKEKANINTMMPNHTPLSMN